MRNFSRTVSRARTPMPRAQTRIAQQLNDPFGRLIDRIDEKAVLAIADLAANAADIAADHGGALPHRLGDGEAEAFARRFLQHDGERAAARRSPASDRRP